MLTLNFQTSHTLPSGSGLVVKGFPFPYQLPAGVSALSGEKMCLKGPNAAEFECRSCVSDASASPSWTWQAESGSISLRVRNGSSLAAGHHQIAWRFYNPTKTLRSACNVEPDADPTADCPSKVRLTLHVSYEAQRAAGTNGVELDSGALGVLGTGDVAAWTRAHPCAHPCPSPVI